MWLWIIGGVVLLAIVVIASRRSIASDAQGDGPADPSQRPITLSDPNLFGVCSECRNHGSPKKIAEYRYQIGSSTYHIGLCSDHARRGYVVKD